MNGVSVRLLFIPVSGPRGMGEYARSLSIAAAAATRWPAATIHFALSREAPYAARTPFPKTMLPSSATFHPRKVAALIHEFRPSVVIFDNAGRTAQLRAARRVGARVVFISSRVAPRRRAFRMHWMWRIDEHWIAYPRFLAGAPRWSERLKLKLLKRPVLRFLNPVLPQSSVRLEHFGVSAGEYVLVVPGGGTEHPGTRPTLQAVAAAARNIAACGYSTVLVGLDAAPAERLVLLPRMIVTELIELMRNARLTIVNGGYTMLQALACDRPCVAVPIAADQEVRIDKCVAAGVVIRGEPEAAALERTAFKLLDSPLQLESMRAARARLRLGDGARMAIDALENLLGERGRP